MHNLEKRPEVLEAVQAKQGLFGKAEVNALMDKIWSELGTSLAEQVAHYGSERALLIAMRDGIQSIQSKTSSKVNKLDNN